MKDLYKITVTDTAEYYIKTDDLERAEELVCEWFSERNPNVRIDIPDEYEGEDDEEYYEI